MTTEWYNYANQIDKMLAEALLISARNSLNNVFLALKSEGDITPAPLIILEIDIEKTEQQIILTPNMDTVGSIMQKMYWRIHKSLESIPRLAEKLDLPKELCGKPFVTLYIEDETIKDTQEKISLEIEYCKDEMENFMQNYQFLSYIWETSEEEFIQSIEMTTQTAEIFEDSIESYSSQAENVAMRDAVTNVCFLMVNQTPLKNTIVDCIEKWQLVNIKLLTKKATSRIKSKLV